MSANETGNDGLFPARVGERLAAQRRKLGLSIDDVSEKTRIRPRHLEAIETGNHGDLPAITYSAGFVKTYARLLGLDAEALARDFRGEMGQVEAARDYSLPFEPADPKRVPSLTLALIALGVAVLLAVGYAVWRGGGGDERAQMAAGTTPAPEAPAAPLTSSGPTPRPAAVPVPGTAPAANAPIVVTATGPVWLKIYEAAGETLFMGEMKPGDRYQLPPTAAEPLIWTGRPEAITVSVGATQIPPLGPPDQTIRDVALTRTALLARLPQPPAPPPVAPAAADPAPASVTPVDPRPQTP